jgi:hypothetical protein
MEISGATEVFLAAIWEVCVPPNLLKVSSGSAGGGT